MTVELADWIVPVAAAVVGVGGALMGARIGATSSLRTRLIDLEQDIATEHRQFQVRTVSAVNELGISMTHVIRRRLGKLERLLEQARAEVKATGEHKPIMMNFEDFSPKEDSRVSAATENWRSVLAEGHASASTGTGRAMEALDRRRAAIVVKVDAAAKGGNQNLDEAIDHLRDAQRLCTEMRSDYAQQVYRELQIEKISSIGRVFQLTHQRYLRTFARKVTEMYDGEIADARARVAATDAELAKRWSEENLVDPE